MTDPKKGNTIEEEPGTDSYDDEEESEIEKAEETKQTARKRQLPPMKQNGRAQSEFNNICYTERIFGGGEFSANVSMNNRSQAWFNQKNLQIKYLEADNLELLQKLRDTEKNLKLNKEMFNHLLDDSPDIDLKNRDMLKRIQQENKTLQSKIKELEKEKKDSDANALILQQIVENQKDKEDETQALHEEEMKTIQENMERKEYSLQVAEMKIYHFEKYVQRKAFKEREAQQLMEKFQSGIPEGGQIKVTNVVDENQFLRNELQSALKEANQLQQKLTEQRETINKLERNQRDEKDVELSIFDPNMSVAINEVDLIDIDKLKKIEKFYPKEYQNRLEVLLVDMEKQIKTLKKTNRTMRSEDTVLKENSDSKQYMINQLQHALDKALMRIKMLEGKVGTQSSPVKVPSAAVVDQDNLDPDNFGNMSSIFINPNDISNAQYASNAYASNMASVKNRDAQNFNLAKEMEKEEKQYNK